MTTRNSNKKNMRKGPTESATKFSVGTKKKGNDGNMWKIVTNKKNTKRWQKVSNVKSKTKTKKLKQLLQLKKNPESVWGKNKKLEEFWKKLASGKEIIIVYQNNKKEIYKMPKTSAAKHNQYIKFENDSNVKAIITSAQSSDIYENLFKNHGDKTPKEIIDNYKKYLTNYGKEDKTWYL